MRYEYRFCLPYHSELIDLLERQQISYKLSGKLGDYFSNGKPVPVFVVFTFKQHIPLVDELSRQYRYAPQTSIVYSSREINEAEMLWMLPKRECVEILNTDEAFSFSCSWVDGRGAPHSHHAEQIAPFVIEQEPSAKGQTAFWRSSIGFYEVFTDHRVKELAESHGLRGVIFLPTFINSGKQSDSIFQMTSVNTIPSNSIVLGKGEKEICCPMCGRKQFAFNNTYQLHLDLDLAQYDEDIYITDRVFGEGFAQRLYLISQRFYQLLKKNKLTSGTFFDPVVIA